jgi:hypothetical protein
VCVCFIEGFLMDLMLVLKSPDNKYSFGFYVQGKAAMQ